MTIRNSIRAWVIASAAALCAATASGGEATLIQYSTRHAFLAATGPLPIAEDFETAGPQNALLPVLIRPLGTFTPLAGEPFANVYVMPAGATNFGVAVTPSVTLTANGDEEWELTFPAPVSGVGFDTYLNSFGPGTLTVRGENGSALGTFTQSHPGDQIGYMGVVSDAPIVSIRYATTNGRIVNTGVDNFRVRAWPPWCRADIGVQGGMPGHDGVLDNNDFVVLIDHFFAHDDRADFGSQGGQAGGDGLFDNNDFVVYIDLFFGGCP